MPYAMTPGGALRIHDFDEAGSPTLESVDRRASARARFMRLQFMDDDLIHAVFRDVAKGRVYTQPIPDQEGLDDDDEDAE